MRIIFIGSASIALPTLDKLISNEKYDVVAVISQPDRPSGRKRLLKSSPVKVLASLHGIKVITPENLNDDIIYELDERDIEASLVVIEGLVKEINSKELPNSILKALKNLEKTLSRVQVLLEKIHIKSIEHTQKYFSSWRQLDVSKETKELIVQFNLLEKRFNLFHKVLLIYKESLK